MLTQLLAVNLFIGILTYGTLLHKSLPGAKAEPEATDLEEYLLDPQSEELPPRPWRWGRQEAPALTLLKREAQRHG